jgi:hypothetical protein
MRTRFTRIALAITASSRTKARHPWQPARRADRSLSEYQMGE